MYIEKDKMQIIIVGAGVVGLHIGIACIQKGHTVFILEQEKFLAEHTSGRNSGVIHAGIFYKTGSLKERFCVRGNRLSYEWIKKLGVAYENHGKILPYSNAQRHLVEPFVERISKLDIPTPQLLSASETKKLEPEFKAYESIFIPSTGIVDAALYVKKLAQYFELQGGQIIMPCTLTAIDATQLKTDRGEIDFDLAINSAGLFADEVAHMTGFNDYSIRPCRGDYYLLNKKIMTRPIYHLPDPNALGLGVHFTPTIDGATLLGPNAFFIDSKKDYAHHSNVEEFQNALALDFPQFAGASLQAAYSGNRPKLFRGETAVTEFTIEKRHNWIHLLGIESPGLTSAPAIAEHVLNLI